ncbi:MAG: class I SAM-dependent methyltransferase [Gallionellaceae bacterium]
MSVMCIESPQPSLVANESEIMEQLLPLKGAAILELGCGKAEKTRVVANSAASVVALEVDEAQLSSNLAISDLPNVTFGHGGAEKIPASDSTFDIVLMFKSLHHVPAELMDKAFAEIHRVLKPGGIVYISEPVFAGSFNEVLRLFHDEKLVREAAFAAETKAVAAAMFELRTQKFFLQAMHFANFDQFNDMVIKVTHTHHQLSPALFDEVRDKFNLHMTPNGADFHMPIRLDLLSKRG